MDDLFNKFTPGHLIGLVATIGGILGWIITTVGAQWRRVRIAEMEAALKQQMLERGMDPAEIEQVLRVGKKYDSGVQGRSRRAASSPKAAVVKALTDGGYEGADIERILRAFGSHPDHELVAQKEGRERAEAFERVLAAKVQIVEMMAENGNQAEEIERVLSEYKNDAEWRFAEQQPFPARA